MESTAVLRKGGWAAEHEVGGGISCVLSCVEELALEE